MTKTEHYNLNKPEVTDPLRLEDFNENADIIDAALGALNTAAAGFGNCHIASGTYVGTGKYGSANPTTLNVGFAPRLVIISFEQTGNLRSHLFAWPSIVHEVGESFTSETTTMIWGDTYFGFYCPSAYSQMNDTRFTYSYIAIG